MKKIFLASLVGLLALGACKKDDKEDFQTNSNNSSYTLIASDTTDNDYIISLHIQSDGIEVGYTTLFVGVKDLEGNNVSNANVSFEPEMDMGMMHHGAPVIQPVYKASSKFYEGVVVFTMPSGDMGTWTLSVDVNGGSVTFPIEVEPSKQNTKYVGSYLGIDGESYILSLKKPFDWQVGMNDITILIHQEVNHAYLPVDDFEIFMDPQMTSMGHGSPNNISPTTIGNGFYTGKVNFTMTGDWRLNFDLIREGDTIVSGAYLDILF